MKNKRFNRTLLASTLSTLILSLSACSSGGKGDSGSNSQVQMSGAVVDDYVAYSRVYVDINNNGKFDPSYEPYAFTDGQGYFSTSQSGQNYCADPKKPEYKFCLNIDDTLAQNAIIRASEGRDLLTALTYDSSLTMLTDGTTSNLVLTALSTLNQIQDQIQRITLPPGLNGTTENKDIQAFLTTLVQNDSAPRAANATESASITPNTANPFNDADIFRIAINTHKLAETLATFLTQTERRFTANNLLGRESGETLSQQDIIPFVYMALFLNLDFTQGSNTLGTIDDTKTREILEDAQKLLDTVSTAHRTLNTQVVISNLQSLYSFLTGLQQPTQDLRQSLTRAELVTQTLRQSIQDNPNTLSAQEVNNITPLITNQVVENYQNVDFDSAIQQAQNGQTIRATGRDFSPILNSILSNHYLQLTSDNPNENQFKIYFKETTEIEDSERAGQIIVCQKTTDNQTNLFKGSWSWSNHKPFIILGQYLDIAVTIKNLEAQSCGLMSGSCVEITYPDIDNENNALKTSQFSDAIDWNTPSQIPQSDLIQPLEEGTTIPQNVEQCRF